MRGMDWLFYVFTKKKIHKKQKNPYSMPLQKTKKPKKNKKPKKFMAVHILPESESFLDPSTNEGNGLAILQESIRLPLIHFLSLRSI